MKQVHKREASEGHWASEGMEKGGKGRKKGVGAGVTGGESEVRRGSRGREE